MGDWTQAFGRARRHALQVDVESASLLMDITRSPTGMIPTGNEDRRKWYRALLSLRHPDTVPGLSLLETLLDILDDALIPLADLRTTRLRLADGRETRLYLARQLLDGGPRGGLATALLLSLDPTLHADLWQALQSVAMPGPVRELLARAIDGDPLDMPTVREVAHTLQRGPTLSPGLRRVVALLAGSGGFVANVEIEAAFHDLPEGEANERGRTAKAIIGELRAAGFMLTTGEKAYRLDSTPPGFTL